MTVTTLIGPATRVAAFAGVTSATRSLWVPVRLPLIVIVSVVPVEKSTSTAKLPPVVTFPETVSASLAPPPVSDPS